MSFQTIPDSLIQVGKSITRSLFKTYVKDNFDNIDSRLTSLEAGFSKINIFNELIVSATNLSGGTSIERLATFRAPFDFDLTDMKVIITTKNTLTGTLQVDLKKGSNIGFTSPVSLFTTKPSLNLASASNYAESSNAVIDNSVSSILEGEYLRLDVTSLPSGGTLTAFHIYVLGEAT
jgi:hypothetical protein